MRVECGEITMQIIPESQEDVDYIERVLGLTANGMQITLERCDWWKHGGIGALEALKDSLNTECAVPIGPTIGEPRIGIPRTGAGRGDRAGTQSQSGVSLNS